MTDWSKTILQFKTSMTLVSVFMRFALWAWWIRISFVIIFAN